MNNETLLTSDVIGLTKVAPFSRRGFMTASAAVAAGYTLAAGPVRADVIKTDTTGLTTGDARIKVADGETPVEVRIDDIRVITHLPDEEQIKAEIDYPDETRIHVPGSPPHDRRIIGHCFDCLVGVPDRASNSLRSDRLLDTTAEMDVVD